MHWSSKTKPEYSQRLNTLLCRNLCDGTKEKMRALMKQSWAVRPRSKRLREKLTSLWSENITEAARDSYEKANQEISSDKLKLAEEKAITKEQNKMRAEEAAHAMTEKMRRVVERDIKNQRKGRTKKPKQNKKNATTSRSKLKKRLTKIHKKKTSLGKIAIGKDMVVSYSQAGLGTDKEREEKRRYFTIC
ncbi:hypothetical protein Bca4012_012895 [Brassica carinata]